MYAVLIVTIIGIICIIISFMMVSKDEGEEADVPAAERNRITDEYELNEEEVAVLQRKVRDKISEDVNDIIYQADSSLSTMLNEKMMALGDYAVTVCDEIEKNHKEVMFLYSMLNDKEKDLKALTAEAEEQASQLKQASELALDAYVSDTPELDVLDALAEGNPDMGTHTGTNTELAMDGMIEESIAEEPIVEEENTNDIILGMKKNGMSIMEIARGLGLGVGEVKLVVDLYQNR